VAEIFFAFSSIALLGFGSVLPIARRMLVETRGWATNEEFNEIWSVCQVLPGPNNLNLALIIGQRFHGVRGAFAAALGLLAAPLALVLGIAALYARFGDRPEVHGTLNGVAAAAAGLILATAVKMTEPLFRRRDVVGLAFAALAFLGVSVFGFPLPLVFLALAPLCMAAKWWRP
jgi:chromate transporter